MWFRAEIAKISQSPAGHVYLELVEEENGQRLAAMRGTLWSSQAASIRQKLGADADRILSSGTEIVFCGSVQYHAVYGVSLTIEELDLAAMIGEAEKRKQATIATLQAEGAMELNRQIALPRLLQRVALIGSPGTSGFRDFAAHLIQNEWGVGFEVEVFKASVQGKGAPAELMQALAQAQQWQPDAVVVVRGGGSALDLDAFNQLDLCRVIAHASVPVLTGIGHETDLSVADLVAHAHFKTPTAVADFLVDRLVNERSKLTEWALGIGQRTQQRLTWERERLAQDMQILRLQPRQVLDAMTMKLGHLKENLGLQARQAMERQRQQLHQWGTTVEALHPENILARGFSVVRSSDKAVRSAQDLAPNDIVHLQFHHGRAEAVVTNVTSDPDEPTH